METSVVLGRFSAAFVLALALGLVRQRLGKPVGFGTLVFVALGACGLALTAIQLHPEDPLPLFAAIVTGIGFLGAGALLRTSERVVGFTSAATIWICAVFGLAVGVGEQLIAGLVYGAIWCVLLIDLALERSGATLSVRRLTIEVGLDFALERFAALGLPAPERALSLEADRGHGRLTLSFELERPRTEVAALVERLRASKDVLRLHLE